MKVFILICLMTILVQTQGIGVFRLINSHTVRNAFPAVPSGLPLGIQATGSTFLSGVRRNTAAGFPVNMNQGGIAVRSSAVIGSPAIVRTAPSIINMMQPSISHSIGTPGSVMSSIGTSGNVRSSIGTPGIVMPSIGTPGIVMPSIGTPGIVMPSIGTPGNVRSSIGTPGILMPSIGTPGIAMSPIGTPGIVMNTRNIV